MEIILSILGGLGLFLFAINNLSDVLKNVLGDKAREILERFTKNIFSSIVTGTIITIILDSSSAVIIMTIVLVNARALSFKNAMGIVMGANIGTTFSSQLIAMDIGKYSPIPIIIGLVLSLASSNNRISYGCKALMYFGILFFGLFTMEHAVEPLKDKPYFLDYMSTLNNRFAGAGTGAVVTLIIQSSSATVGMVITLAKKGLIELSGAIAVMLGAELGTCSDTLLATIRSNRQAVKTGLFHLGFNIITITIGLSIFPMFVSLIERISGTAPLKQQVANAHILFNVLGVVVFLPFVGMAERALNRWIPERTSKSEQQAEPQVAQEEKVEEYSDTMV